MKINKIKKAIVTGLAGLALAMPMKANAESFLDKIDVGVSAGVEYNFKNPIDYTQLNKDFRDGKYTSTTPIPQWEDIQAGNSFVMPEVKGNIGFKIADGVKVAVKGGYKWGKGETRYDKTYQIFDGFITGTSQFIRNEMFDVTAPTIGLEGKINLSNDTSVSLAGNLDFTSVKGNVSYTENTNLTPNNPNPPYDYTQWRTATSSGSGMIPSVEASLEKKITDGVSISVAGGMKFGKVETSGEEWYKDTTGTLDWKKTKNNPYSTQFKFDNLFAKLNLTFKF